MKQGAKISIGIGIAVAVVLAVAIGFDVYANQIITKLVRQALDEQIAELGEEQTVSYDDLSVDIFLGNIWIKGIQYASKEMSAQVTKLEVKDVDMKGLLRSYMQKADTLSADSLNIYLLSSSFRLNNSKLSISVDSVAVGLCGLGYNLRDSVICYSDSCYSLALLGVNVLTPDGLTRAKIRSLQTTNAGSVEAEGMRVWNCVEKTKFAEAKGNVPVIWTDTRIQRFTTSPVNVFHMVADKRLNINKVSVAASSSVVYKDVRYKAKEPYPMPQEVLSAISLPFNIGHLHISLTKMDFSMVTSEFTCGNMGMEQIVVDMKHVTNQPNKTIQTHMTGRMSHGGECDVQMSMQTNKACTFSCSLNTKNVQASGFDDFLKPLFGATMRADIKSINTSFQGDKKSASGTFCMAYSGLRLQAYKTSPIKVISRGAGAINFFAPLVIPSANPLFAGNSPRSYNISFTRDPMQDFAIYMVMGVAAGAKATLLPGLYIKDRIRQEETDQTTEN